MRIALHKLSDERHALELTHDDGRRERAEVETRSYLVHDLLHFAIESEAGVADGFWGSLARGTPLAVLNDREAPIPVDLLPIERIVGALSQVTGELPSAELAARVRAYEQQLGGAAPAWLTAAFVDAVRERMRRLLGHWRATRFGDAMELEWPQGR